jgi:hypothetical protein
MSMLSYTYHALGMVLYHLIVSLAYYRMAAIDEEDRLSSDSKRPIV